MPWRLTEYELASGDVIQARFERGADVVPVLASMAVRGRVGVRAGCDGAG